MIQNKNILKNGFPPLAYTYFLVRQKNIFMQRLIPPPANISLKHKKKACRLSTFKNKFVDRHFVHMPKIDTVTVTVESGVQRRRPVKSYSVFSPRLYSLYLILTEITIIINNDYKL
jgi:hypothetical protein